MWSQRWALMLLWPLNCDLCMCNPLIMFTLVTNLTLPPVRLCRYLLPVTVHHQVAFVQLWPHLLNFATLKQPFHRQIWATSEVTVATLASDASSFDLSSFPFPDSHPANFWSLHIWYSSGFCGCSGLLKGPQPSPVTPLEKTKAVWFWIATGPYLIRTCLDQQNPYTPYLRPYHHQTF